ncbi:type II toxin-antitoxin system RelE/ParE family toxin [Micromonospora sp. DT228]|uniref:type II toxin-antitoxin system RelE/ParE family toxin n=1 Tax=Micromonospora sp. DT228 TaxID=3393443 RepID=UPI003CEF55C1
MSEWEVGLTEGVEDWLLDLAKSDPDSADQVAAAIDLLAAEGPALGRPLVDRVKGSNYKNMKELRPGSAGGNRDPYPVRLRSSAGSHPAGDG